jgi:hypothetical protein
MADLGSDLAELIETFMRFVVGVDSPPDRLNQLPGPFAGFGIALHRLHLLDYATGVRMALQKEARPITGLIPPHRIDQIKDFNTCDAIRQVHATNRLRYNFRGMTNPFPREGGLGS